MKKYLSGLFFVAIATVAILPPLAHAEATTSTTTTTTTSVSALLELLQNLMKQVADLQKQLTQVQSDIKESLKDGLHEGMTDEDIKKIQELLATDPTLYPKGIVTGYFGPLTKDAIKRFQERHELKISGEVDSETKSVILEYFKEKTGGKIPPGLLRAPGIDKKIKERLRLHDGIYSLDCKEKKAVGPLCKFKNNDDENDDEGGDKNDDEGGDKNDDDNNTSTSTATSTLSIYAQKTIDNAEKAIDALDAAITTAENEDAINEAEDRFDSAIEKLGEAQNYFDSKKYDSAIEKARKAERIAKLALIELVDAENN